MSNRKKRTPAAGLSRCITPLGAWALAFGCAVGWGAFVMPGTAFLPLAGPLGSALGLVLGGVIMLVIGFNYHYMIQRYPDAGGTFSYAKRILGYDHGFLSAWFLLLVYIAIVWANASALPLVFRNLLGPIFKVGYVYTVAGYDVYLGEILLSMAALALPSLICALGGRLAARAQTVMAVILFGGVLSLGIAIFAKHGGIVSYSPPFAPADMGAGGAFSQIMRIVALAPWCFVGFESVSHVTEEYRFHRKRTLPILLAAVAAGTVVYAVLALAAASVLPEGYGSWPDYIRDIGNLPGLEGLPAFYAVRTLLGQHALAIITLSVLSAVGTGLLGNSIAASRLIYALSKDGILPRWLGRLNRTQSPVNAFLFIMVISLPIPFLGRTAIGWIVDVNTIGATIAYAYTSLCAYRAAKKAGARLYKWTGLLGIFFSIVFFLYFLIPNFWSTGALSTESYLILIAWSVIGFVFFRFLLIADQTRRFGQSTAVWIVILFMIFFTSTLWVRNAAQDTAGDVLVNVSSYNDRELRDHGIQLNVTELRDTQFYLRDQMSRVGRTLMRNSMVQLALVMLTLYIMFDIYNLMMKRERDMEVQKIEAEQSSRAKSTFLSNMSHDIRTPMNAIIGYVTLSRKEADVPPRVSDYLTKIEASSSHLLSLINDVLEMSRIESGKMELEPEKTDLSRILREVRDLFATQMETKGLTYTVEARELVHKYVLCDGTRLNRVLLNLISNAFKFTPVGGSIAVTLTETGVIPADSADPAAADLAAAGLPAVAARAAADSLFGVVGGGGNSGNSGGSENGDNDENDTSPVGGGAGTEPGGRDATGEYGCYEIRVKDTGMGMSPEFAARVFEAYERERRASKIQGTGLGMAITKSIVDLMGGKISVESQEGVGSEFLIQIRFPLVDAESMEEDGGSGLSALDFTGVRLLLAEDNAINREIAILLLEESGFALDTAENGKIAVEKVAASQPGDFQCVLMDIQMPVMDGYEAARAIRNLKNKELANIPIVAMTANAFNEDIQAARDAGMDSHIAKPIDVAKMMETLAEVLQNGEKHYPPPPPRGRQRKR